MTKYAILTVIGIVILLIGLSMPATETRTTESCVDSPYSYGQDCVQTSYEVANPARGPTIGFGFFLAVVGGVLWSRSGSGAETNGPPPVQHDTSSSTASPEGSPQRDDESRQQSGSDTRSGSRTEQQTLAGRVRAEKQQETVDRDREGSE